MLLMTVQGLRPDVLGALDASGRPLTPRLDAFFAAASAAGTAVSPSPETAPALVSVLTGLTPWQHQTLTGGGPQPSPRLHTVAEVFRDRGFATTAVLNGRTLANNPGFLQGFENSFGLRRGARVRRHLSRLSEKPSFTWIHLAQPQPPYFTDDVRQGRARSLLPMAEMEPYRNPATPLPAQLRERFWRGYLRHVSWLDRETGRLFDALRASGRWDDTSIVFVSLHGEEFGEHGQIGHGNNLGRAVLEVPWALKLPADLDPASLRVPQRPALVRLVSTLLAAGGAVPAPALAPSLFEASSTAVLSELYRSNGVNRFSLLDGDLQLVRTVRFTRPERRYYLARRQLLGDPRAGDDRDAALALFQRLERAFLEAVPFSAPPSAVETRLYRWTESGVVALDDPEQEGRMNASLARHWSRFLDRERAPRDERDFWRGKSAAPTRRSGGGQKN